MTNKLRQLALHWLGLADHDGRLHDLERHFVTKRNAEGKPVETLADVPLEERKERQQMRTRGMSWQQKKAWLEATDGGRRLDA
jgi:hypothetical protein